MVIVCPEPLGVLVNIEPFLPLATFFLWESTYASQVLKSICTRPRTNVMSYFVPAFFKLFSAAPRMVVSEPTVIEGRPTKRVVGVLVIVALHADDSGGGRDLEAVSLEHDVGVVRDGLLHTVNVYDEVAGGGSDHLQGWGTQ